MSGAPRLTLLLSICVGLASAGCGLPDALESLDPILRTDEFPTRYAGMVVDARTGAPIDVPVTIRFSEEAAPLLRDLWGRPLDSLVLGHAAASFSLSDALVPRPWRPVELRISGKAAGYRPNSTRVVAADTGLVEFRLLMNRDDDAGSETTTATFELDGDLAGSLPRDTLLAVPAGDLAVLVAAGEPVGAHRSIQLRYSRPSSALLASFPGGLDSGTQAGGVYEGTTLTTGGVARIDISDASQIQASIAMTMGRDLFSIPTNRPASPGDAIEVYRWSEAEGTWTLESEPLLESEQDQLVARFQAGLPGVFSAGYRTAHCATATIRVTGNTLGGAVTAWRGEPALSDGFRSWRFSSGASTVRLVQPPSFWRGVLEIRHGNEQMRVEYDGLCGRTLDVALQPVEVTPIEWHIDMSPCKALRVTALSNYAVLARPDPTRARSTLGVLLDPPYLVPFYGFKRDVVGRPVSGSFTTTHRIGSVVRMGQILGVDYAAEDLVAGSGNNQLHMYPIAGPAGICVSE